jgi:hypothetical protein
MITVTPEETTQFRSQFTDNPEALAALDAISKPQHSELLLKQPMKKSA